MFKTRKLRPAALPGSDQYTSTDVARICGVSLRQLQWWDEQKILRPQFSKRHRRLYHEDQIGQIRKLVQLRNAGASLQEIRKRKLLIWEWDEVRQAKRPILVGRVLVIP